MTPTKDEHSLFGPSSAHRRIACPGSANAERGLPESTSAEAADGSAHHAVLEKVLLGNGNAFAHAGSEYTFGEHTIRFDRDRARVVQMVADRVEEEQGRVYPEVKISLGHWLPGEFGTSDIGIVRDDKLIIRDAKFGRGNFVLARENPQCQLYAAGFYRSVLLEDKSLDPAWLERLEAGEIPIHLEIDQPYRGNFDSWQTTLPEVLAFAEKYQHIVEAANRADAPRVAGPGQCEYCKAKATCATFTDYCLEALGMSSDDLNLELDELKSRIGSQEMTPEQRAKLHMAKGLITKLLDGNEEALRSAYLNGGDTGGLKLIPGASRKVWKDEEAARDVLVKRFKKEQVVKESLVAPNKALDLAGPRFAKKIASLITVKENKPSLVPESHKTPGIARAIDMFDDLNDETPLDFDLDMDEVGFESFNLDL